MAARGIFQLCVAGRTSRNCVKIMEWYSNLYYGIGIFCTKINGIEIFYPSFYDIISDLLINHRPLFAVSAAAIVHNKALSNLPSITQNLNTNSECI
jgi:hypothetical protein